MISQVNKKPIILTGVALLLFFLLITSTYMSFLNIQKSLGTDIIEKIDDYPLCVGKKVNYVISKK